MPLQKMENAILYKRTKRMAKNERLWGLEVIRHLQEINSRRLYLDYGRATLFELCTEDFGYSSGDAQRKIDIMRLSTAVPEVTAKLEQGTLNVTAAAQLQSFFAREEKSDKTYAPEQKLELIDALEGKSTRDVERELVKISPKSATPEKVRHVSEDRVELKVGFSFDDFQDFEHLKNLMSHKNPSMSFEDLFKELKEIALEKLDPERKEQRIAKRRAKKKSAAFDPSRDREDVVGIAKDVTGVNALEIKTPKRLSRRIPLKTARKVWIRDGGQCTHLDSATGRRCQLRHLVQKDHVQPFALGGGHEEENLRLLCSAHNQDRARRTFSR